MSFKRELILLFFVTIISSCAIQQAPDGGTKDELPPKLKIAEPENFSIGFTSKEIRLTFDEFIALNDLTTQLVVSPLLKYAPDFKIRKKTLIITIKDTLIPNTTYTMNFGSGIMDNNEGNKLEDFQYVFSTGNYLDSLSVSGLVEHEFDKSKEKSVIVALYTKDDDSLPYKIRPLYFSKTNDDGIFKINNIAKGEYKIIALKDADGDYLFNGGEELIGFSDSLVTAGDKDLKIEIFKEASKLTLLKSFSEIPGKSVLVFNGAADSVKWKWIGDATKLNYFATSYSSAHDSVYIWYKNLLADSLSLALENDALKDTVILRLFKKTESNQSRNAVKLSFTPVLATSQFQHIYLPYRIQSNHPIDSIDFAKFEVREDSVIIKPHISFADSLHSMIDISMKWKDRGHYTVFVPPSAITDIYGLHNDTIDFSFNTHSETDYGSVSIKVQKAFPEPIVLQLTDEKGITTIRETHLENDTTINFSFLDPSKYRVKIIRDSNWNGKWDTGNYLKKIQPEEISFYPEIIAIRANWDVEILVK